MTKDKPKPPTLPYDKKDVAMLKFRTELKRIKS